MGYLNEKNHVVIHQLNCWVAQKLKANHGNRILEATWNIGESTRFIATIEIQGIDRIGLLNDLTRIISTQHNVNIKKLVVQCDNDMFNCTVTMQVKNTEEVNQMIKNIRTINGVGAVNRI